MRHWWQLATRNWQTRPARAVLASSAVALGVGVVVWVTCCYESVRVSVTEAVLEWIGRSHVIVEPIEGVWAVFDQEVEPIVARIPGVSATTVRTREYVEIVRAALRRERLEHHGAHYNIPVRGGTGLGKPLRLMTRPLRSEVPIYLAANGPKAVELAFEIGDGWLPIFWSPEHARSVFPLDRARPGFDIAPSAPALLTDDVESGRASLKEYYSFYIGGMGARGKNFYNDLFSRYGYEAEAREIQDLFLGGQQREAAAKVPDAFVDEVALVGSKERIADRLAAWRESGATTLLVSTRDDATLRALAEAAA